MPQFAKNACAVIIIAMFASLCVPTGAAVFSSEGGVLFFDGAKSTAVPLKATGGNMEVSKVWGELPDGRAIVTINDHAPLDPDAVEGHSDQVAGNVGLIDSNGNTTTLSTLPEALRVFPSPGGTMLAIITPARDLVLCATSDGYKTCQTTSVTINGRVSHAAWSPDGAQLAAAVYPPDFSPQALDNARNPEEFLRLQNSDIYLVDAKSAGVIRQVTSDPGTEYNPFFSPNGAQLYSIALGLHDGSGGIQRVSATAPETSATQITKAGAGAGEIPLGRVGTYLFPDDTTLLFEAGQPDGSGEIWRMKLDGTGSRKIRTGRYPQKLPNGNFAILDNATPAIVTLQEVQK